MSDSEDDGRLDALPSNALIQRLQRLALLGARERHALDRLMAASCWLEPGEPILSEGEAPRFVIPLLDGLACRYTQLRSGRRQIISVLVPGDLCTGFGRIDHPIDYSVRTVSRARVALIDCRAFRDLFERHAAIAAALQAASLVEENVLRAWIVNLGQRPARERMAHLLCELEYRIRACGRLLEHGGFELPFTQLELGSALGLTSVHVNRVLQSLRADKLIDFHHRVVRITDHLRLRAEADFDPAYLELRDPGAGRRHHAPVGDVEAATFPFAGLIPAGAGAAPA